MAELTAELRSAGPFDFAQGRLARRPHTSSSYTSSEQLPCRETNLKRPAGSMRRAFSEGLRAGWDDAISSAVLAREIVAALFEYLVDLVSGRPLPHIHLPEQRTLPEIAPRSRRRDQAA